MATRLIVRKNEYIDSIQLMRISEALRSFDGVAQAFVAMATPSNRQILNELGLAGTELSTASPGDLFIALEADSEAVIDSSLSHFYALLKQRQAALYGKKTHRSLETALRTMPEANLCLISVPGQYAYAEAEKALSRGLHVMVYSDNVPLHQDRRLKELAAKKGLLCMGPDCGVSNINGIALMTASVSSRGPIGIIGASGSGTQQIAVICDKEGAGISQAIGVGGKDLLDEVGGLEMLFALNKLEHDPQTEVIILVSRTPGDVTQDTILNRVRSCKKPVVVYFIGGDPELVEQAGALSANDLEEAAMKAVDLVQGRPHRSARFSIDDDILQRIIADETNRMAAGQRYLRGLYCGGTFCEEAMSLLLESIGQTFSNAPLREDLRLTDSMVSKENTLIDLGDEEFTLGRPHPVIDPE
ncbi:MAG: hypothetical protein WBW79_16300, partial [Desulfocapsaceae bacterium]